LVRFGRRNQRQLGGTGAPFAWVVRSHVIFGYVLLAWPPRRLEPIFALPVSISFSHRELVITNYSINAAKDIREFALRPYEARVYALS
jgi:hypothetical protein